MMESGNVTDVRLVQPSNADIPIIVMDSGKLIEMRLVHFEKACSHQWM